MEIFFGAAWVRTTHTLLLCNDTMLLPSSDECFTLCVWCGLVIASALSGPGEGIENIIVFLNERVCLFITTKHDRIKTRERNYSRFAAADEYDCFVFTKYIIFV